MLCHFNFPSNHKDVGKTDVDDFPTGVVKSP